MTVHGETKVALPSAFEMAKKGADYRRLAKAMATVSAKELRFKDSYSFRTQKY
jgi:hypothetical protein